MATSSFLFIEPRTMNMYDEPNANPIGLGASVAPSFAQSWRRCCERLRAELGEDIFNSWFGRIELEAISGGQARLSVPTRFLKSWIDTHYLGQITAALVAEVGPLVRIAVSVRSSARPAPQENSESCEFSDLVARLGRRARAIHLGCAASDGPTDLLDRGVIGRLTSGSAIYLLDVPSRAVQSVGIHGGSTRR